MKKKKIKKSLALPVKSVSSKDGYGRLVTEISGIITRGRTIAIKQIDITQAITYWLVGRRIVEFYQQGKQRAAYGEQLLGRLAVDLTQKHGRGFSERNLEMMRISRTSILKQFF